MVRMKCLKIHAGQRRLVTVERVTMIRRGPGMAIEETWLRFAYRCPTCGWTCVRPQDEAKVRRRRPREF
jgi:hypothetical protein